MCRLLVLRKLYQIGKGFWKQDSDTKALRTEGAAGLQLWHTVWCKGGHIVFEVALDYSETSRSWTEMLRLWVCNRS